MTAIQWVAPAPLWSGAAAGVDKPGFAKPWLAEFDTDDFMTTFLALMDGEDPGLLGARAPATSTLYQPFHQRYYLVVGSLVCRQFGLPDHTVMAKDGERASFVVRRVQSGGAEQAWVGNEQAGSWVAASASEVVEGEERHQMHPVPTALELGGERMAGRQAWYGYVPVSRRDKYVRPLANPVQALVAAQESLPAAQVEDPRLSEFTGMVLLPWRDLFDPDPRIAGADRRVPSLHVLLNLRDWLDDYLPAVRAGSGGGAAVQALRNEMQGIEVRAAGVDRSLLDVLDDLTGYEPLVAFLQTVSPAVGPYDLRQATHPVGIGTAAVDAAYLRPAPGPGALAAKVQAALNEGGAPVRVPAELEGLIKDDTSNSPAAWYVLRLVYEHEPCRPVLSAAAGPVQFAKLFDPDAPARKVRVELPDISNLRKFKRGVGMEMPPSLRQVTDRLHKGMIDEEGLNPAGGWELGMICSFSIQIIMLVAFVVMFIFLFMLNFVFWWLAFLKICFPIPRPKS